MLQAAYLGNRASSTLVTLVQDPTRAQINQRRPPTAHVANSSLHPRMPVEELCHETSHSNQFPAWRLPFEVLLRPPIVDDPPDTRRGNVHHVSSSSTTDQRDTSSPIWINHIAVAFDQVLLTIFFVLSGLSTPRRVLHNMNGPSTPARRQSSLSPSGFLQRASPGRSSGKKGKSHSPGYIFSLLDELLRLLRGTKGNMMGPARNSNPVMANG